MRKVHSAVSLTLAGLIVGDTMLAWCASCWKRNKLASCTSAADTFEPLLPLLLLLFLWLLLLPGGVDAGDAGAAVGCMHSRARAAAA
jgi:hypothetical protein